jgi:hypothetical protein
MVIELDLGELPDFADLPLVTAGAYRGVTKAGPLEPLAGRVQVGGPHGFAITKARVAGDEGLGRFIGKDPGVAYYYVWLGITFVTHAGPRLDAAQLKLALTAAPADPAPFALSVRPAAEGVAQKVARKVTLGSELALPGAVKADVDVETSRDYERTRLFVRGLGLGGSTPGWEFTRAPGKLLEGSCLLEVVVQATPGARITVGGTVTAQTAGGLPFRARTELPSPLTFSGDI